MQIKKMANGQYAVCWQTVNYFECWAMNDMAGSYEVANDV